MKPVPLLVLVVVVASLAACGVPLADVLLRSTQVGAVTSSGASAPIDPLRDHPLDDVVDEVMFARAALVIRARRLEPGEGSKIKSCWVAVERVLKNTSQAVIPGELNVGYVRSSVPEGHCTLYLQPWGEGGWRLVDTTTDPAISHRRP